MITINLDKAKQIAHEKRRAVRAEAFAPLDAAIAKRLPGFDPDLIEMRRQRVRDADAMTQAGIDAAPDAAALAEIMAALVP